MKPIFYLIILLLCTKRVAAITTIPENLKLNVQKIEGCCANSFKEAKELSFEECYDEALESEAFAYAFAQNGTHNICQICHPNIPKDNLESNHVFFQKKENCPSDTETFMLMSGFNSRSNLKKWKSCDDETFLTYRLNEHTIGIFYCYPNPENKIRGTKYDIYLRNVVQKEENTENLHIYFYPTHTASFSIFENTKHGNFIKLNGLYTAGIKPRINGVTIINMLKHIIRVWNKYPDILGSQWFLKLDDDSSMRLLSLMVYGETYYQSKGFEYLYNADCRGQQALFEKVGIKDIEIDVEQLLALNYENLILSDNTLQKTMRVHEFWKLRKEILKGCESLYETIKIERELGEGLLEQVKATLQPKTDDEEQALRCLESMKYNPDGNALPMKYSQPTRYVFTFADISKRSSMKKSEFEKDWKNQFQSAKNKRDATKECSLYEYKFKFDIDYKSITILFESHCNSQTILQILEEMPLDETYKFSDAMRSEYDMNKSIFYNILHFLKRNLFQKRMTNQLLN